MLEAPNHGCGLGLFCMLAVTDLKRSREEVHGLFEEKYL